jgi:hypothetical protein
MTTAGKVLTTLGIRNPKDILREGLQRKVDAQGDLRRAFDITTEFPSRETFDHDEQSRRMKRRIVVKQINNTVAQYAVGNLIGGEFDFETLQQHNDYGWVDLYTMEVSVWTTDSKDRDDIVELIKLWMLELEQDIKSGDIELELPFFFDRDIFAIRFIRGYEDVNNSIYRNGPVFIGSLVYSVTAPFYHRSIDDDFTRYKVQLIARITDSVVVANQEE